MSRLSHLIPKSAPSLQGCACHGSAAPVATAFVQEQALVVTKRLFGTSHTGVYGLDQLVAMLDPMGTSYVHVGSA